ncbi:phytoene desaturase family protein [Neobacillus mesonae]|nr:phytoene desaturase family protein [Neobacillus mesonae]
MKKKAVVIGAGFGGLSCAIRLAYSGMDVTVIERQQRAGGKLQRVTEQGYTFDRGPSTITMPHVFRRVFEETGVHMNDYVRLYDLDPRTRNVFADGTVVDLTKDRESMKEQIAAYSPADALRYEAFMQESKALYGEAESQFLNRLLLKLGDKYNVSMLKSLLRVRPLVKLDQLLRRYFRHPNTLMMLGRYATYIGSSPYLAPSIFAMLGHVETELGIYGVEGGTYSLISGMVKRAEELGARIHTGEHVHQLRIINGRVSGVETSKGEYAADVVVINGDVLSMNRLLIPEKDRPSMNDKAISRYEPSLSGFVTLCGVRRQYEQLHHHTVFFPQKYEREFTDIFHRRKAPQDPTLYLCYSGYSEPGMAPEGGSNLFILANSPYVSEHWSWAEETAAYRQLIFKKLSSSGIEGLDQSEVMLHYNPEHIEQDTLAYRGGIYGISSNTVNQTFFRPGNRHKDVQNLWFVGGTTHPGGGTPIVTLSGQLVGEHIAGVHQL